MDANGFVGLCRAIVGKIPNAEIHISEGACELKINQIDISLFFNPLFASDRMHCFVDIGAPKPPAYMDLIRKVKN